MFEQQEEPAFGDGESPDVPSAKPGAGDAGSRYAGTPGSPVVDPSADADGATPAAENSFADGHAADIPPADDSPSPHAHTGREAPEDTLAALFLPNTTPDADAVAAWIQDLDADALLDLMSAAGRVAARAQAIQLRAIDAFARRRPSDDPRREVSEFAVDEIAPELHLSRAAAQNTLALARALCHRLPATLAALQAGEVDLLKARAITQHTTVLDDKHTTAVEHAVLPRAGRQTLGQVHAALGRAVHRVDPEGAAERHRERRRERSIQVMAHPDGMADLSAYLPAEQAVAIYHKVDHLARTAKTPGDDRTADQRRVDVFADLLLGTRPDPTGRRLCANTHRQPLTGSHRRQRTTAPGHDGVDPGDTAQTNTGHGDTGGPGETAHTDISHTPVDHSDVAARTHPGTSSRAHTTAGRHTRATTHREPTHRQPLTGTNRRRHTTADHTAAAGHTDTRTGGQHGTTANTPHPHAAGNTLDAGHTEAGAHCQHGAAANTPNPDIAGNTPGGGMCSARDNRVIGRGRIEVLVTIPATTLLGLDNGPAELAGYGAITAEAARQLAHHPNAVWRRLLTDPVSSALLDYGRRTYHPPTALHDHVTARDGTCRFPGCQHPARHADLDHTVPYPHGPTAEHNLGALCRHHHRLKTHSQWRLTQDQGTFVWTSPTGRTYTRTPEPLAEPTPVPPAPPHTEDDDPPPF